ncbi:hypothetical protein [Cytobacillus praedii]|uniref:hypothetical protein n=1 Tax=Cytobacillus praedii TaxID=1742358 RepID=UPI002E1B062E|nr:hypothetical protein [Cytobacillus praedii]
MHKSFNFPINCYSPQTPLNEPEVIETELGRYIRDNNLKIEETYEAFDTIEIIPSLIETVEKMKKGGNEEYRKNEHVDLVIEWMKKWGYLKANQNSLLREIKQHGQIVGIKQPNKKNKVRIEGISNKPPKNFYGQRVSGFVQEANKFYDFWMLYKAVANRDLEQLKKYITVQENPELPFAATHTFYFFTNFYVEYVGYLDGILDEQNPLEGYQFAAVEYLTETIEKYINNNRLFSREIKHSSYQGKDQFKMIPAMGFSHLLDALYMQFYILLNENEKKICPVCNKPFVPERKDRKYCSDTCKYTAKSQRYRARKSSII